MSPQAAARFTEACDALQHLLAGEERATVLAGLSPRDPVADLRALFRSHRYPGQGRALATLVPTLDAATSEEGFHVLHTWDPGTHRFRADPTSVLLLGYVRPGARAAACAVLLDAHLLLVLTLLVMRVWDAEDPDAAMDRVTGLLALLQGPQGSGRRFADDAPTLLSLAIAQYQPDEHGFDALLDRIRTLHPRHQERIAQVNAANFGAHLRWGSRFMYGGDMPRMRSDNVVDYPWVLHAGVTMMQAWEASRGRDPVREAASAAGLLDALSADPGALADPVVPEVLAARAADHAWLADRLAACAGELCGEFVSREPGTIEFSPLALHFNFLHNVLTAGLDLAVGEGAPNVSLNALLERRPHTGRLADSPSVYAHQLAAYAAEPTRRGARGAPLIVVDPAMGAAAVRTTVSILRAHATR